jgi:hypothetical protein
VRAATPSSPIDLDVLREIVIEELALFGRPIAVGGLYLTVDPTDPNTTLGYGTWVAWGSGRVPVGFNALDSDFNLVEKESGAKTVAAAGSVAAPTISGSVANESAHTHNVTSNVAVADHGNHVHSGPADHASHTHTYTEVPNHVHGFTDLRGGTTGVAATNRAVTEGLDNSSTATGLKTANPDGGVGTGTTNGPSAALSHGNTGNPTSTLSHGVTNNAVASGAGSAHSHGAGTLAASAPAFTGTATSVLQPSIVCHIWKRTA